MEAKTTWGNAVVSALHGYQQQGFLCDLSLTSTDGQTVKAHSCILAAACPQLYEELADDKSSKDKQRLELSGEGLQALVSFLYTGILELHTCQEDESNTLFHMLHILSDDEDEVPCSEGRLKTSSPHPEALPAHSEHVAGQVVQSNLVVNEMGTIQCRVTDAESEQSQTLLVNVDQKNEKIDEETAVENTDSGSTDDYADHDALPQPASPGGEIEEGNSTNVHQTEKTPNIPFMSDDERSASNSNTNNPEPLCTLKTVGKKTRKKEQSPRYSRRRSKQTFPCSQCGRVLMSSTSLKLHVAHVHDNIENFSCKVCGKKFARKVHCQVHQQSHNKNCSCKNCFKKLKSKESLLEHEKACNVFRCGTCRKTFSSSLNREDHRQAFHKGTGQHVCSICGGRFSTRRILDKHTRHHTSKQEQHSKVILGEGKHTSNDLLKKPSVEFLDQTEAGQCQAMDTRSDQSQTPQVDVCLENNEPSIVKNKTIQRRTRTRKQLTRNNEGFPCSQCDRVLMSSTSLKLHIAHVHNKVKNFSCDVCGKKFARKVHCQVHQQTHEKRSLTCQFCSVSFPSCASVSRHESTCSLSNKQHELGQKNKIHMCRYCFKTFATAVGRFKHERKCSVFPCGICKEVFPLVSSLENHRKDVHKDASQHICTVCGVGFCSEEGLLEHNMEHTGSKGLKCSYCKRHFKCKNGREKHEASCSEGPQYKCTKCEMFFKYKREKDLHDKQEHSNQVFQCTQCGKILGNKDSLYNHMKHMHSERQFICTVCRKAFKSAGNLKEHHQGVHLKLSKCLCSKCGKSFPNKTNLKLHELTHAEVKEWPCLTCGKMFLTKVNLYTHRKWHGSERPHKCSFCEKSFLTKSCLQIHERRHTGVRPFKCDSCDKAFVRASDMHAHKRSHTGERPYQCSFCLASYRYSGRLKQHQEKKHGLVNLDH